VKKLLLLFIILIIGVTGVLFWTKVIHIEKPKTDVETLSIYERMDQLSQEVYSLTKEKKFPEAKAKLEELGRLFASSKPPKGLTIESLDIITETIVKAKQAFASITIDPNQLLWHALQVRLTMDSLTHAHQPLWKNYYKQYKEHIQKLTIYVGAKKKDEFNRLFLQNIQLYQMLKPAMSVSVPPHEMEQLLSIYRFLLKESRQPDFNWNQVYMVLNELNRQIDKLFIGKEVTTFTSVLTPGSPYHTILLVTTLVIVVLGYVAYQKYQAMHKQ
jgi:sporulation protein YpjB